ncbi:MAG TPA: class I SAM-dependent methyltransferase [Gammaproteobacteria bacterium]|nr:class I SAM-dependent methyltransferase [Gammaproteobacteria bacterium]
MRLDTLVHRFPGFYEWKLEALKTIKKGAYKALLIDSQIQSQRAQIAAKNAALLNKYLRGKKVLEIGCGRGSLLAGLMRNHGCECVGIDLSEQMIDAARRDNPGPDYHVMRSDKLKFDDRQFDFVIFNYVLHHVDALGATIAEAKRVGKHVILWESCACDNQPFKLLSRLYWKITDGGYQYYSLDEWKAQFQATCLDEIKGHGLIRYGMCVLET